LSQREKATSLRINLRVLGSAGSIALPLTTLYINNQASLSWE